MRKRLAIVTGGTRGIGAAIAIALKDAQYEVIANYCNDDALAEDFAKKHHIKTIKWDVGDFAACEQNIAKITSTYGKHIEILVNNAGIVRDSMLHKMQANHWHEVINTNLNSCFNMCYAVINKMREQEFGRIVNISSINALSGQVGQTNYSAAKAAILGFTKALARESAAKNITVNAIAPGYIKTEMMQSMKQETLAAIIKDIPVKRLGNPEEIARAVLFLVSDDAGFITGETLSINGGHRM